MAIGMQEGFNSALFAVTTIFAFIVMYDACHVRYYSGKNIELVHKFTEVVGGFVVGIIVPLLICPLFLR